MTPRINDEIRSALHKQAGKPLEVEDEQTHLKYVLIPASTFAKIGPLLQGLTDDAEWDVSRLLNETFGGPEGWDAPGMEAYDDYDGNRKAP